jgi:hypothetical protein
MSLADFSSVSDAGGPVPAWLTAVPAAAQPPRLVMPPPLPSQNYFLRHWRGERSLKFAWWINGALLGLGFVVALVALFVLCVELMETRPQTYLPVFCATYASIVTIATWQIVGIWRSGTRYRVSGKPFWGGLAKCVMLLAVSLHVWTGYVVLPKLRAIYEVVQGDALIGPHSFAVTDNGDTLEFSGGITFGVAEELETRLDAMDHVKTVKLNSHGGRSIEAEQMAELIKARGLSTAVAQTCLSACPTVFLAGRERVLLGSARIGFHQPTSRVGFDEPTAALNAEQKERLVRFGLSEEFAARANQARPSSMWYPAQAELLREKVATKIVDAEPAGQATRSLQPTEAGG